MSYPYDPQTRERVARLLYDALPAFYRVKDGRPEGREELARFLRVLAAPLATVRQNVEELHADLFIDSAGDWVIPYLAEMVGTTLIFPDADANRRDVRETVSWRRRKGTPATLQELAGGLSEQLVVTREGWKLVQMTQDLNLPRADRRVPDVSDPRLAETSSGPLVSTHHAVDLRRTSRTSGRFHPRHVVHWTHPTLLFDVRGGTPADLRDPGTDPDLRFAFHPLGETQQLRARRTSEDDDLATDRVPPMHFAADPGAWFGRAGRFSVEVCGLPAAVGEASDEARNASFVPASRTLLAGDVAIHVLEHDGRRFAGPVEIEVLAVPLAGPLPAVPDAGSAEVRARLELDAGPPPASTAVENGPVDATAVAMIRLRPGGGAGARYFPGATVEVAGGDPAAALAGEDAELAREGFLRGALFVELPATRVDGERLFYLAADGSVHDAQSTGAGAADVEVLDDGGAVFDRDRLLATGPGAAWPPLAPASDPRPLAQVLAAPGRPPVVMHGGAVLEPSGDGFAPVADELANRSSLVFALSSVADGVRGYRPFLRLQWSGPHPAGAEWRALRDTGTTLPTAQYGDRFAELAAFRDGGPAQLRLAVRFESAVVDAVCAPSEVAFTSDDGRALLIYLPQMECQDGTPVPGWTTASAYPGVSEAVNVAADGSTWVDGTTVNARRSLGGVAPLRPYAALRRRRVAHRSLCQWRNEVPPGLMHAETAPGRLDVDVLHGLFSLAATEAPQAFAAGPGNPPPPSLGVVYQEGYSAPAGALADRREARLDRRLATPTRLVSRSGHLHRNAPAAYHALPRYSTLGDALAAIAADPRAEEVVQFEDSATYPGEDLVWPAGCDRLTVQATEQERPVLEVATWGVDAAAAYETLHLLGLRLGSDAVAELALPPAEEVALDFVGFTRTGNVLVLASHPRSVRATLDRCLTAGLRLAGPGDLRAADSVIDAGLGLGDPALVAPEGRVSLERVTVFGTVACRVLEASEVYFEDDVTVEDRFDGCVRYSRVPGASRLPRVHRVVEGVEAELVSSHRHDPAHARLAEGTDPAILRGAEDGGEIGAFHDIRLAQRTTSLLRRLNEFTPAGLATGLLRVD